MFFPPIIVFPLGALIVTAALLRAAQFYFPKYNLLDFPQRYGIKRAPIPYPTGIIAVIVFLIASIFLVYPSMQTIGIGIGALVLGIASFIDDRRQLPAWFRLVMQTLIALIIFATGSRIYTITNPADFLGFGEFIKLDSMVITAPLFGSLPILSGVFTLIWLGLTMNALNWFDGIPGQVSVLSTIGFVMLGLLAMSVRVDQPDLALICFTLAGIAAAYVAFDFPPPKMLMGDSGSMFFGLMLGLIGIYQGGKVATAFLVLAFPLCDAFLVVITRLIRRKSPLRGDRDHLHHRLVQKGWSARSIVIFTGLLGSIFGISALFMDTVQKGVSIILLFALVLLLRIYAGNTRD